MDTLSTIVEIQFGAETIIIDAELVIIYNSRNSILNRNLLQDIFFNLIYNSRDSILDRNSTVLQPLNSNLQ